MKNIICIFIIALIFGCDDTLSSKSNKDGFEGNYYCCKEKNIETLNSEYFYYTKENSKFPNVIVTNNTIQFNGNSIFEINGNLVYYNTLLYGRLSFSNDTLVYIQDWGDTTDNNARDLYFLPNEN